MNYYFSIIGPSNYIFDHTKLINRDFTEQKRQFMHDMNGHYNEAFNQEYNEQLYNFLYGHIKIPLDTRQAHNGLFNILGSDQDQLNARASELFRRQFLQPELNPQRLLKYRMLSNHANLKVIQLPFFIQNEVMKVNKAPQYLRFISKMHGII